MNKLAYWILGLLFVALFIGAYFGYTYLSNLDATSPNTRGTVGTNLPGVPEPGSGNQIPSDAIYLATTDGKTIPVKNFKNDPVLAKDPVNPGYYYFGYHYSEGYADSTATDTPPYVIQYTDQQQFFTIALLKEPIRQTRLDAEQYLMAHLGITQSQMCMLKYMVSVPARINIEYSGTDLRFSFCDGETPLP